MRSSLLHPRGTVDLRDTGAWPLQAASLREDLGLDTLAEAMAQGDRFIQNASLSALVSGAKGDMETILHRQGVLEDCLRNESAVREMYALCSAAVESKRERYIGILSRHPGSILYISVRAMRTLVGMLRQLRGFAVGGAESFVSEGFTTLFDTLRTELDEDYLTSVERHLRDLEFRRGVLVSARLGPGDEGTEYTLRVPHEDRRNLLQRLLGKEPPGYSFRIADRDEAGSRILSEIKERGINRVADALAQSTDHIYSFFEVLRGELGFYVGCLHLREALVSRDVPVRLPAPKSPAAGVLRFRDLRDPVLALSMNGVVVGNSLEGDGRDLLVVTGPNQGGKSTFLRSLGIAQLMMQAGMFVAADSFEAEVHANLFTHFIREEDATMNSGRLDEELARMSDIVTALSSGAFVLLNESFASTNEREGSEIAWQVVRALRAKHVKVGFVTHLHDFARRAFRLHDDGALFLRAERREDGTRTFRLVEAAPQETSHGMDLYRQVFGSEVGARRLG